MPRARSCSNAHLDDLTPERPRKCPGEGNLRIMVTTFKDGDPSFAGALDGLALGLKSYNIFELKKSTPADVQEREMAFKELEMEAQKIDQLSELMREIRND